VWRSDGGSARRAAQQIILDKLIERSEWRALIGFSRRNCGSPVARGQVRSTLRSRSHLDGDSAPQRIDRHADCVRLLDDGVSGRAIQHFAVDDHGCRSREYRVALKLNRHRNGNGPEVYADCMRDVTKVVAETTADRERQQLSALEPETMAASMTFGSIDHYRMRTRPTQSCFGARNVAQFDRDRWRRRPPSSSRLAACAGERPSAAPR
jgi:hypothetical protein